MTGYYRHFIKSYAQIAGPLTDLLRKNTFEWNQEAKIAFQNLKQVITTAPVLSLPDFSKPFTLETDAFGIGVGQYWDNKAIQLLSSQRNYLSEDIKNQLTSRNC